MILEKIKDRIKTIVLSNEKDLSVLCMNETSNGMPWTDLVSAVQEKSVSCRRLKEDQRNFV